MPTTTAERDRSRGTDLPGADPEPGIATGTEATGPNAEHRGTVPQRAFGLTSGSHPPRRRTAPPSPPIYAARMAASSSDPTPHTTDESGGDPACWAHLGDPPTTDDVVVDLSVMTAGGDGVIWHLPHGGDLDANLVRLGPGASIGEHVNAEVDVLVAVQTGAGVISIDGRRRRLAADHVALVPRGASRSIVAGTEGLRYLSIHRRRTMTVGPRRS